jgi:hypothetical protein
MAVATRELVRRDLAPEFLNEEGEQLNRQWLRILNHWSAARHEAGPESRRLRQLEAEWERCVQRRETLERIAEVAAPAAAPEAEAGEPALYGQMFSLLQAEIATRRREVQELHAIIAEQAKALASATGALNEKAPPEPGQATPPSAPRRWAFWRRS